MLILIFLKGRVYGPLKDVKFQHYCADERETLRYAYLSTVTPLRKQQKNLEEMEAELERKRAQMFPNSKEDFKTKSNDIKIRAARFLCADHAKQEKMLTEYQWAWRQVKPLQDVFAKDVSSGYEIRITRFDFFFLQDQFRSEMQGMVIAAGTPARDPRRRTSL